MRILPMTAAAALAAGAVLLPAPAARAAAPLSAPAAAVRTGTAPTAALERTVDRAVADRLAADRIPGAAVTVVSGGRTVLAKGYGVADTASKRRVDADRTGFFLGSLGKLFTAQAASQLAVAGKVDPKADVNRYLRRAAVPDTYPGRPVTLDNLLTHTGGFDSDIVGRNRARAAQVEPLAEGLTERRPARVRPPGTLAAYDNYGFALAGEVVAEASGESFPGYLDRHVFGPLGMTGSTAAQPGPASITGSLARGYRPSGDSGWTRDLGQYGSWSPAGPGIVSTAADMGRWMRGQLGADPAARLMQRAHFRGDPRLPGLGYGFEEWRRGALAGWFKDGDIPGFHSNLLLLPRQHVGVFVVFNGDGTDGTASWDGKRVIDAVADALAPGAGAPAPVHRAVGVDAGRYAGTYRPARVSRHSLMKVEALVGSVTVRRDGGGGDGGGDGGGLVTDGLSLDPEHTVQHWVPLGEGMFQERGGTARIAFPGTGGVLVSSVMPSTAYQKVTWSQSPALHMALLAGGGGVLALGAVAYPVTALVRRVRRRPAHAAGARAARMAAALAGVVALGFAGAFAAVVGDGNAMMEMVPLGSPLLSVVTWLGATVVGLCAVVLAGAVTAWCRGWWTRLGRLALTATALAGAAASAVLLTYHLAVV
ncbi:hypothetical protein BIV57_07170 [Mangrovactinospora gilvigrisea]|uniref:Beta-lactamase-related domain-containing protein n=1 Tax=Mangrovactinospora gilvigrisea TaxID=1428644 RepID=A0A1J7BXE2_9ACTN|nr:serine hydrolase domain-containing protein [Mangrovactinospora gilvigrisea]OIV38153.1 hypothetical protein BIV57_07170 [Mangrovactinospora gilvigrisea]